MFSSAFCQHLPALLFHQTRPAVMPHGNTFFALTSTVISHGDEMCSERGGKKKSEEETEAASQRPHCLSGVIVSSSIATVNLRDGWLTCSFHSSPLLGSPPVDRIHSSSVGWEEDMETERSGRSLSIQNLPHCSI